jgi:hypothetical protein
LTGFFFRAFFFFGAAFFFGFARVAVFRVVLFVVVFLVTRSLPAAAVASVRIKVEALPEEVINRENRAGFVRRRTVLTELVRLDDDDVRAVATANRTKAEAMRIM